MKLKKMAQVGTLESSDIRIIAKPNPNKGIDIILESIVKTQFGDAILETVSDVLKKFKVEDAIIDIIDKGALDYVIRSRMQSVICRAAEIDECDWERM